MHTEVIRESDGALLGYVQESTSDTWLPVTVFGHPLGPASSQEDAVAEVERTGLSSLMEHWWFRHEGAWYRCRITEANAQRVRVQPNDVNYTGPYSVTIRQPTPDVLRDTEPAQG